MSLGTQHGFLILTYCLVVGWRLRRLGMRWRLPLTHGPEYFVGLRVPKGFATSTGTRLMIGYRCWLLLPWVVEAISASALISAGQYYSWLGVLISGGAALDLTNWLFLLRRMRKTVKPFAIEEAPTPIALPLLTRKLRTYTKPWVEVLIGATLTACFSLIVWHGGGNRFRVVLIAAYVQLGLLLIKRSLVDWRTRVPVDNAEAYHHLQELRRTVFIDQVDWLRGFAALFVVILTIVAFFGEDAGRWMTTVWLVLTVTMMLVTARETRRMTAVASALKPLKPKRMAAEEVNGAFLYRPDLPAVFVRRQRGYALNFGNPRTLICAAYVLGGLILGAASLHA
jgi:hypothetical protein